MKRLEEATVQRQAVGNDTGKGLMKQHQPELKSSGPRGGGANTGFRIAPPGRGGVRLYTAPPASRRFPAPTPTKPWPWHRMALGGRCGSYLLAGPRRRRQKIRGPGGRHRRVCSQRAGGAELGPRAGLGRLREDAGGRVAEGSGPRAQRRARGEVRGSRGAKRASPRWSLAFWETSSPRSSLTDSAPDDLPSLPPSSQDPPGFASGGLLFVFPGSLPLGAAGRNGPQLGGPSARPPHLRAEPRHGV